MACAIFTDFVVQNYKILRILSQIKTCYIT